MWITAVFGLILMVMLTRDVYYKYASATHCFLQYMKYDWDHLRAKVVLNQKISCLFAPYPWMPIETLIIMSRVVMGVLICKSKTQLAIEYTHGHKATVLVICTAKYNAFRRHYIRKLRQAMTTRPWNTCIHVVVLLPALTGNIEQYSKTYISDL